MAKGFVKHANLLGVSGEVSEARIIENSVTVTIADALRMDIGFANLIAAGERIYGVALGFRTKGSKDNDPDADDGVELENATSGTDYDGTFTVGGRDTGKYVATSDNQTDKKVRVVMDIDPFGVWANEPDAAIGTDTESDLPGSYTDLADEDQVDEDSAHATTVSQALIYGINPNNSAEGLYLFTERQQFFL